MSEVVAEEGPAVPLCSPVGVMGDMGGGSGVGERERWGFVLTVRAGMVGRRVERRLRSSQVRQFVV